MKARPCLLTLVCLLLYIESAVPGGESALGKYSGYRKMFSWQETRLAAEELLRQRGLQDEFAAFESGTKRGGDAPQSILIDIAGAKEMYLFVTGIPDTRWGVADWADAKLITADGSETALSKTSKVEVLEGRHEWDINLHSGLYEPMRLQGRPFKQGLHVQAYSVVRVPLEGKYQRFEAWIGIDDWAGTNGHARFSVVSTRTAARKRLWERLAGDFNDGRSRQEMRWEQEDRIWEAEWVPGHYADLAQRYARACEGTDSLARQAQLAAGAVQDKAGMEKVREIYYRSRDLKAALTRLQRFDFEAFRLAMEDLRETYGSGYATGPEWLGRLEVLHKEWRENLARQKAGLPLAETGIIQLEAELQALHRKALLANPLLDFDRLLMIRRAPKGDPRRSQWADRGLGEYVGMPRQSSWGHGTMTGVDNWDNEIAILSDLRQTGEIKTLFKPRDGKLVSDVDLHFDGDRLLFAMPDDQLRWQIFELQADGRGLRQLSPSDHPDVHHYDPCYLPNGNIAFISTAPLQGVPCNAGVIVGMMYLMDGDGNHIRQVCFEQDHDYNPSVLNDGRVLYLRWDYTDTPHVWNRVLMSMNPDGTGQMEFYGSNSYWPNAVFFGRAVPGHPTKIAGIVTGHHEGRVGDLVIFDAAQGRHEVEGVVQRIPGRGQKVEAEIEDKLTEHNWPKFLHPYPLSEKYYLVSCKPTPDSLWGIYLVDVFDNMVLIREEEQQALLEPIPFRPSFKPPVIPDKVQPHRKDALVLMTDVYSGPGLKDVPRGTVKSLRVFTYHFGYQKLAGIDHRVGTDGPWEVKRVLGTVPVEADGSAFFRVPAKYPISVQPLDEGGKAVALMRSWMTAMPGETVSCVGCHERQSSAPPSRKALAVQRAPSELQAWHGPVRGFSFQAEVQPVLDRYCVGCHNGQPSPDGPTIPDLRGAQGKFVVYEHGKPQLKVVAGETKEQLLGKYAGVFEPSYIELRQYVRVGKLESDLHLLPPKEFHADTSELIQMLRKGHHHVELDAEAWDRLITWIDLNAPCHGAWADVYKIPIANQPRRRQELRRLYGGIDEDAEQNPVVARATVKPVIPQRREEPIARPNLTGWPLSTGAAKEKQRQAGTLMKQLDLGNGVVLSLARIPAGSFVMGDAAGESDEKPLTVVNLERAFWMGRQEVSNEQYRQFDPQHDSRFEHRTSWMFSEAYLGWPLNRPRQPVVRVSWEQAMAFCRWLSEKTGLRVTLPTEVQWEYACRAGTDTPLFYGDLDADFSAYANVADITIKKLAYEGWRPLAPDLLPRDARFDDGMLVTAEGGIYQPNPWGLYDMHGNAAEWTLSPYAPRLSAAGGPDSLDRSGWKVVRGGSWRDRPKRCRSSFRLAYPAYQKVFNVGFRVVVEE